MTEGTHKHRTPPPTVKRDVVHVVKVQHWGLTVTLPSSRLLRQGAQVQPKLLIGANALDEFPKSQNFGGHGI